MFDFQEHRDNRTNNPFISVGVKGRNVYHFYFTDKSDFDGSTKLLLSLCEDNGTGPKTAVVHIKEPCAFYAVDLLNKTDMFVDDSAYYQGTVCNDVLYYTKGDTIYKTNLLNIKPVEICKNLDNENFYGVPSVSNDGEIMTVYWKDDEGKFRNIAVINTLTGIIKRVVDKKTIKENLSEPNNTIEHPMINPVFKDICFFCRDGDAFDVNDRIWTINLKTKEFYNLYGQRNKLNGKNAEGVGHESWSYDGEKLYFVKYFKPYSDGVTGIMSVTKDGTEIKLDNSDYSYLHASSSPDGRYLVADTKYEIIDGELKGNIVLIDLKTKRSTVLATVGTWYNQPGHIHPTFTLDSKKIIFTFSDEKYNLRVGIINLSEVSQESLR